MEPVMASGTARSCWMTRAAVAGIVSLLLLLGAIILNGRGREEISVVRLNDVTDTLPTVPTTVPGLPEPVDTTTLQDGWYLALTPLVFTTEDELLLQAARELTIEARSVGYQEAMLIRKLPSLGTCGSEGCGTGTPAMGYFVLLKGPYSVPSWGTTDVDLDAKFSWHQTTQSSEVADAAARGLTTAPGLVLLDF